MRLSVSRNAIRPLLLVQDHTVPRLSVARFASLVLLACFGLTSIPPTFGRGDEPPKKPVTLFDHKVKTIDGADVSLARFQGDVLLIVNTASQCGYTSQYESLEALYLKYKAKGFRVLAFPSNDFGRQEPGTEAEIKAFCQAQYHVSFPLFAKTVVKGEGLHPVYSYLTGKDTNPKFSGEVTWNFAKFLVNRKGEVIARFEPAEMPDSEAVIREVELALAGAK